MMSATILDKDTFCRGIGLEPNKVKFIQVDSDFPVEHRPICPLNVAYLNYGTLQQDETKMRIAQMIDKIMSHHREQKGIVHCTSYQQVQFIKNNISKENRRRLLETDPDIPREEIIAEHIDTEKPTVLISPSLHLGLDLRDERSRWQVIVKVPWPSKGDRWIDEKRRRDERWYILQTALRLIQAVGRSVRSREDWAITYLLDSCFRSFMNKNRHILPNWFSSAIKY
jgi:Rad3-related DNA helicase